MKENCRFCQQGKPHEGTIISQDTIDMGQFGEIRLGLTYWDRNGDFLPQLDLWLEDNTDEVISSQILTIEYCPLCGRKLWDDTEVSLGQAFMHDKERIKEALEGRLMIAEGEDGFVYSDAPKEDCRGFILAAFDNAVYHALEACASASALEAVMEKHGLSTMSGELANEYLVEIDRKSDEMFKNSAYVFECGGDGIECEPEDSEDEDANEDGSKDRNGTGGEGK